MADDMYQFLYQFISTTLTCSNSGKKLLMMELVGQQSVDVQWQGKKGLDDNKSDCSEDNFQGNCNISSPGATVLYEKQTTCIRRSIRSSFVIFDTSFGPSVTSCPSSNILKDRIQIVIK